MVCWLFSDSLEIGSCGEGLRGFVKHETKGGLAPQSTVSGLRDFRKMHTSIWKILYGTICVLAKLRFSSSENIYLEKKKLKVFISAQSFPSACHKCGFCSFWPIGDSTGSPASEWLSSMPGYFQGQSLGPAGLMISMSLFS